MSSLHFPVPEGGRAGDIVVLESDAHGIGNPPLTLIAGGSGGALTHGQVGGSGPASSTPFWYRIGTDAGTGADVFVPVWK